MPCFHCASVELLILFVKNWCLKYNYLKVIERHISWSCCCYFTLSSWLSTSSHQCWKSSLLMLMMLWLSDTRQPLWLRWSTWLGVLFSMWEDHALWTWVLYSGYWYTWSMIDDGWAVAADLVKQRAPFLGSAAYAHYRGLWKNILDSLHWWLSSLWYQMSSQWHKLSQ